MWHPLGTTEGLCLFKNNEMEGSTAVWKQGLQVFSERIGKQSRKSLGFSSALPWSATSGFFSKIIN